MMISLSVWLKRRLAWISAVAVIVVLALSMFAIHRLASHVQLGDIRRSVAAVSWRRIGMAIVLTGASYALLMLYDVIALKVIKRPLPLRLPALASFTSYALSHNIGFSWLTGGSARLRIYGMAGLGAGDVARIVTLAGLSFWLGVITLLGVGLICGPELSLPFIGSLGRNFQGAGGIVLLAASALWLLFTASPGRRVRLFHFVLPLPSFPLALSQILVSTLDVALATAALTILLPHAHWSGFPQVVVAYSLAIVAGLVTHVPGGVGVFEAMMLLELPQIPTNDLLSALLLYRLIYYVLPLLLAAAALLVHEAGRFRNPAMAALKGLGTVGEYLAPSVAALLAFVAGVVLLVSAALPGLPERLSALHHLMPLAFIEISHFASSLVGTALILFAPALYRRLDGAYLLVRLLLVAGMAVSLSKGFDWEEALILGSVLLLLSWARPAFYRRTRLASEPLSPAWIWAGAAAGLIAIAIGLFAYKRLPYDDSLWWTFTLRGNGPRFLRAMLGLGIGTAAFFIWHGFAPAVPEQRDLPEPDVMARALAATDRSDAWLAATGDKDFLIAPEGDCFLMFRRKGRSWIAIGDPVGNIERWPDLMWRLRELADRNQGRVLFYQLSTRALPFAVDMGLSLLKYGEEAHVDLNTFSLEGAGMRKVRGAVRKLEREGASFEVLPPETFDRLMDTLAEVSDAWLAIKHGREKRFSVGRFDAEYLLQMPMAIVRQHGRITAFANIWPTASHAELSIDLMRHLPDAANGTMDFLLVSLFRWGKAHGYRRFNLGLAPLSGLEARRLAPAWTRFGHFLYRYGENIYGFEGLRTYKEKFQPAWQPRYIAGPAGLPMLRALVDLGQLVSR